MPCFYVSIPFWSDFNGDKRALAFCCPPMFQSHFGLILTRLCGLKIRIWGCVSIPFWSDFNSSMSLLVACTSKCVSIPFWSDFNVFTDPPFDFEHNEFQSHFGLILTMLNCRLKAATSGFNPILV